MKPDEGNINLFPHFIDETDMTLCCAAASSGEEIDRIAGSYGLYFPLICRPETSLQDHLKAMEFTPKSARFGPYADNILGMNWELASGKVVRIGERVVKSTTGYDLLRFLLHSDGRYGRALDYVVRLRPKSETTLTGTFNGGAKNLERLQCALRTTSWNHWIDSIDLVMSYSAEAFVEVSTSPVENEGEVYIDYFQGIAAKTGCVFSIQEKEAMTELPLFTVKTTPSQALKVAEKCIRRLGGSSRILLLNGVVLVSPESTEEMTALLQELQIEVGPVGGHLYGMAHRQEQRKGDGHVDREQDWSGRLEAIWREL